MAATPRLMASIAESERAGVAIPLSDSGAVKVRGAAASFEEQPAMKKENKRNLMTEVISKTAGRYNLNSLILPRTLPNLLYPRDLTRACQEIFYSDRIRRRAWGASRLIRKYRRYEEAMGYCRVQLRFRSEYRKRRQRKFQRLRRLLEDIFDPLDHVWRLTHGLVDFFLEIGAVQEARAVPVDQLLRFD